MPRITCKTPASGKPLNLTRVNIPTTFTNLADAPDFSVPDPSGSFTERDPADNTRAIRPGEIFLLTPLAVYNKTATARWVEVQFVLEAGTTILSPGRVTVPPNDTVYIPVQGRSLVKRNAAGANGDLLQIRAENATALDVWGSAEERLSAEHIGVV
jgi:hypothetical protein